jgi:hypothetical protein
MRGRAGAFNEAGRRLTRLRPGLLGAAASLARSAPPVGQGDGQGVRPVGDAVGAEGAARGQAVALRDGQFLQVVGAGGQIRVGAAAPGVRGVSSMISTPSGSPSFSATCSCRSSHTSSGLQRARFSRFCRPAGVRWSAYSAGCLGVGPCGDCSSGPPGRAGHGCRSASAAVGPLARTGDRPAQAPLPTPPTRRRAAHPA